MTYKVIVLKPIAEVSEEQEVMVVMSNEEYDIEFDTTTIDKIVSMLDDNDVKQITIRDFYCESHTIADLNMLIDMINYAHDMYKNVVLFTDFNIEKITKANNIAVKEMWRKLDNNDRLAMIRYKFISSCDTVNEV